MLGQSTFAGTATGRSGSGSKVNTPQGFAGRGAGIRPDNPHLPVRRRDDWEQLDLAESFASDADFLSRRGVAGTGREATQYGEDLARTIVNRNDSPDLPFRWSLNPYRGCEHGCSYCYARNTHEFLGLDAGVGFESRIFAKPDAPELFRKWLDRPGWSPEPVVLSGVTDCYQPIERRLEITRACLQVAAECRQPIGIVTKNRLVTRDIDVLQRLAEHDGVVVAVSLTTLDPKLARRMEPRTSSPQARLETLQQLAEAGVPTHAMLSPVIPGLNDHEIPELLSAVREAGTRSASYTLLRLSGSVREVFLERLHRCEPDKAPRVEALIRGVRRGRLNDTRFGDRMSGVGVYAGQVARTFRVFAARNGLDRTPQPLNGTAFRRPKSQRQLSLFGS